MPLWTFLVYTPESEPCQVHSWYEAQGPEVRAAFDAVLIDLGRAAKWKWNAPDGRDQTHPRFKELSRKHAGLSVLRFEVLPHGKKKRRFRIAGMYREELREFVLLIACEKGGGAHLAAFDKALEYKRALEQGRGSLEEYNEDL